MKYLLATAAVFATLSAAHAESIHDTNVYSTTFTSGAPAFQKAFENIHFACQSPANIPACSKALSAGLIAVHDFQQAFVGVRVPEYFHSDSRLHPILNAALLSNARANRSQLGYRSNDAAQCRPQ